MMVAVIGSRDISHSSIPIIKNIVKSILSDGHSIVTGGARGVDFTVVEEAFLINSSRLLVILPKTISHQPMYVQKLLYRLPSSSVIEYHGTLNYVSRCFIRNCEIINKADKVIAFIKNNSRGTTHAINYALSRGFVIGKNLFIYKEVDKNVRESF